MDRKLYKAAIQKTLLQYPCLELRAGSVFDLDFGPDSPLHSGDMPATVETQRNVRGVRLGMPSVLQLSTAW